MRRGLVASAENVGEALQHGQVKDTVHTVGDNILQSETFVLVLLAVRLADCRPRNDGKRHRLQPVNGHRHVADLQAVLLFALHFLHRPVFGAAAVSGFEYAGRPQKETDPQHLRRSDDSLCRLVEDFGHVFGAFRPAQILHQINAGFDQSGRRILERLNHQVRRSFGKRDYEIDNLAKAKRLYPFEVLNRIIDGILPLKGRFQRAVHRQLMQLRRDLGYSSGGHRLSKRVPVGGSLENIVFPLKRVGNEFLIGFQRLILEYLTIFFDYVFGQVVFSDTAQLQHCPVGLCIDGIPNLLSKIARAPSERAGALRRVNKALEQLRHRIGCLALWHDGYVGNKILEMRFRVRQHTDLAPGIKLVHHADRHFGGKRSVNLLEKLRLLHAAVGNIFGLVHQIYQTADRILIQIRHVQNVRQSAAHVSGVEKPFLRGFHDALRNGRVFPFQDVFQPAVRRQRRNVLIDNFRQPVRINGAVNALQLLGKPGQKIIQLFAESLVKPFVRRIVHQPLRIFERPFRGEHLHQAVSAQGTSCRRTGTADTGEQVCPFFERAVPDKVGRHKLGSRNLFVGKQRIAVRIHEPVVQAVSRLVAVNQLARIFQQFRVRFRRVLVHTPGQYLHQLRRAGNVFPLEPVLQIPANLGAVLTGGELQPFQLALCGILLQSQLGSLVQLIARLGCKFLQINFEQPGLPVGVTDEPLQIVRIIRQPRLDGVDDFADRGIAPADRDRLIQRYVPGLDRVVRIAEGALVADLGYNVRICTGIPGDIRCRICCPACSAKRGQRIANSAVGSYNRLPVVEHPAEQLTGIRRIICQPFVYVGGQFGEDGLNRIWIVDI